MGLAAENDRGATILRCLLLELQRLIGGRGNDRFPSANDRVEWCASALAGTDHHRGRAHRRPPEYGPPRCRRVRLDRSRPPNR